jgi:Fur family transcriptional regulator, ferric uptake regulator
MTVQAIHKQEKEQFIKLFKQDRIDRFNDRLAVLEIFLMTEHHLTAQELAELVNAQGAGLEFEFVRDTIELMCQYGFARKNVFDNGDPRYEHLHLGQHHDHMICTKCKRIFEFQNQAVEQLQLQIAAKNGFHLLQHKMELYGICRQCLEQRDIQISLDNARQGEKLVIKGFSGGRTSRLRLVSMGLRIGDQIEIISNVSRGEMVVAADFKRLVIGRGLAQKIQVSLVSEQSSRASGQ